MEKRLKFPEGKQKEFLINSKKELKLNWSSFAEKLNVNVGTLEKAYRYELCSLPYKLFKNICHLRKISVKNIMRDYKIRLIIFDPSRVIGRKVMGETRIILPESNITFRLKPKEFNLSMIKPSQFDRLKKISFPKNLTPELAEEIGISLGDGFLSNKKFEYRLKGNKNEKEYYDIFLKTLYKNLFSVKVNIKEYETTYGFELYSKAFWEFKAKCLGLPIGRKNNAILPVVIKVKDENILTAFIRGIFDTDGSVSFIHKYGLGGYYPIISITLKPKRLLFGIANILDMLGLEPRVNKSGDYWVISLNGYERLRKYSKIIGWNNTKNINKVVEWKRRYPELGKEVMADVV